MSTSWVGLVIVRIVDQARNPKNTKWTFKTLKEVQKINEDDFKLKELEEFKVLQLAKERQEIFELEEKVKKGMDVFVITQNVIIEVFPSSILINCCINHNSSFIFELSKKAECQFASKKDALDEEIELLKAQLGSLENEKKAADDENALLKVFSPILHSRYSLVRF